MADTKFSQFNAANPLADADQLVGLQGGPNVRATMLNILGYIQDNTTADDIGVGINHIFLSNDGKTTDNLIGCPNFDSLKTEIDDHIADTNNPHDTTLQQAYNQDSTTVVANLNPVSYRDSNSNLIAAISTTGSQNHYPLFHLVTSTDVTLNNNNIDTIYINDNSASSNTINIQLESGTPVYAENATFIAWRLGSEFLNVIAPIGVTINGVDNATVSLATAQRVMFVRLSQNTWVSLSASTNEVVQSWDGSVNPVNVTAGSGIDITNGVISLDGTGASAGYGYIGGQTSQGFGTIGFTDTTSYFIPFATNTPLVDQCNNMASNYDGFSHLGIKNIGLETGVFEVTFTCVFAYPSSNTNPASNDYFMCANLNRAAGPGGSYAPINPISGGSASDQPFTVFPNYLTVVSYTFQIELATNDVVYPLFRNNGNTDAALNKTYMPYYSIKAQKIGDTGGSTAGVTSLGGATGNIGLGTGLDIVGTDLILSAINSTQITNGVNFFDGTYITSNAGFTYTGTVLTLSTSGAVTAPTIPTEFNIASQTQLISRIALTGQEFGAPANTSSDGIAMILGVNRTANKQLWIGRTDQLVQNTTNVVIRMIIPDPGNSAVIDSTSPNGATILPIQFGNSGAVTTLEGFTVTVPSLGASLPVFTDASKNLTNSGTISPSQGGTGQAGGYTIGDLLYASATNGLSKLPDVATGQVLVSGGVGAAPLYASSPSLTGLTLSGLTATSLVATNGSKALTSTTNTINAQLATLGLGAAVSSPSLTSQLNVFSTTQNSIRLVLSGQEYTAPANTSNDGVAFVLGINRSNNKQLWIADSARLASSSTNPIFRITIASSTTCGMGCLATDGTTGLPMALNSQGGDVSIGANGAANLIISTAGSGLNIKSVAVSAGTANAYLITGIVLVAGTATINNSVITSTCAAGAFTVTTSSGTPGVGGFRVVFGTGTVTITGGALDTSTGNLVIFKGV